MKMITFEQLPEMVSTLLERVETLTAKIEEYNSSISARAEIEELAKNERKIFGVWHPADIISSNDPRLWTGKNAPFDCRDAMYKAIHRGCPFVAMNGMSYKKKITAEALENWLLNTDLRKKCRQ